MLFYLTECLVFPVAPSLQSTITTERFWQGRSPCSFMIWNSFSISYSKIILVYEQPDNSAKAGGLGLYQALIKP